MSLLFFGSGRFALPALELLAARRRTDFAVVTVPDAPRGRRAVPVATPVKRRAAELGLPCHEVATLKRPHDEELLARTGAGLVITADIRLFLTERFLAGVPLGCWNLHPSLLPHLRGAAPVARAILAGERRFGVTLYRMVRVLDAGPVVARREWLPDRKMDTVSMEEVLSRLAAELLAVWLPSLERGEAPLVAQDPAEATHAPRIEKDEGWIEWRSSAEHIEDHVLGMQPWPRAFTRLLRPAERRNPLLFIDRAMPFVPESALRRAAAEPGTILDATAAGIDVACGATGSDTVRLSILQREGKRPLPAAEFLRGRLIRAGDRLGRAREDAP